MPNWPSISLIKARRAQLKINQEALAKQSGVSQAVISRIENGRIADPSYSIVQKLFNALDQLKRNDPGKALPTAEQLMSKRVISIKPHQRVAEAWKIMKQGDYSQLPVIDENGRIHGSISMDSFPVAIEDSDKSNNLRI